MLASLQPKYKFTDGPGYIIGAQSGVKGGSKLPVYIPSLMPDIEKTTGSPLSKSEKSANSTVFANLNHPNMKGTVTTTNYIYAKGTGGFVMQAANDKLAETGTGNISHIPNKADMKAGATVMIRSNTGCFRDLYIS